MVCCRASGSRLEAWFEADTEHAARMRRTTQRATRIIRATRWSCISAPTSRCKLDAGVELSPFQIAYKTYGTLNADALATRCWSATRSPAISTSPTCIRSPARSGWWETMVGPGKPIDTDRYFVICPNVVGGCMGSTGPASTNPATGKPWGLEFPVITIRDMVRAQAMLLDHLGIDTLFAVVGGSMGGMQVLQWAASYPRARVRGAADRLRHAPFGAEHRVPRGRPPGDHGRSGMARRPLSSGRHQSAPRARGRAHGRAHHLSVGRRAAPEIRPQIAGPRESDLLVRRGFRGRILSAPSGHFVRRALRRQFLSLSDARDGLFRSRRRLRRRAGQCLQGHADALLRGLVHQRLAVPDRRNRAPSCTRSMPAARASRSPRSSPTRATTPSCSTSRSCSPSCAAFSTAPARRAAWRGQGLTMRRMSPTRRSPISRATQPARASTSCWSPRWSSAAPRCSTSAAATASCCSCSAKRAASTAAASNCRAKASTNASPRGWP